jgi:hypothetical protein
MDTTLGASAHGSGVRRDGALLLLVLAILLLSTLDGIFTLILLDTGLVREWNPFLAPLIDQDVQLFANVKTALTKAGVFVLVVFVDRKLFRRIPVKRVLDGILLVYCLLILYHLTLMTLLVWR